MKTKILVKEGEYQLAKAGVMDAKIDAEELFCFMTGMDKVTLFLKANEEVSDEDRQRYEELIAKRATRVPLQHITGEQEFMGYRFRVSPDVLVPRQDTETLVTEAARALKDVQAAERENMSALRKLKGPKELEVLDLCCGSGAVGISLAKICPGVNVTATDVSSKAVAMAADNAKALRVKMKFACGDMFAPLEEKPYKGMKFDMIVSNPPYIKTNMIALLQEEVKAFEPREALDGGRDGLDFYRIIIDKAPDYLKPEGWLMMEIGYDQGEDLRKLLRDSGRFTPAEVVKDLPGKDRVVKCRLMK